MSARIRRRQTWAQPRLPQLGAVAGGEPVGIELRAAALAESMGLPAAEVIGAASFFSLPPAGDARALACRGTSCTLRGAAPAGAAAASCLGYCDRSPVHLRADGRAAGAVTGDPLDPLPRIRVTSRAPVVLERLVRGRCDDIDAAREAGAYEGLAAALRDGPARLLEAVDASALRGRGGAGFPAGAKWRACAGAPGLLKVAIANGDEGDPGSFVDRTLMECDPHTVLEGLLLCAFAVGAAQAIVFVRGEYPRAAEVLRRAVRDARTAGLAGPRILGSGFSCEIDVVVGLGSYVCGEETALLAAVEGRRGEVRLRPPYPTAAGLWGMPTVVGNVETLASVPWIVRRGPRAFREMGAAGCSGTKVLSLSAGFAETGLVEVEFGADLGGVIAGAAPERPLAAVLVGGPMGSVLTPDEWNVPVSYMSPALRLGHGGIVAVPEGADWNALAAHWLAFWSEESCGKCAPCALGSRRAEAAWSEGRSGEIDRILDVAEAASLCAFGQMIPQPIRRLGRLAAEVS